MTSWKEHGNYGVPVTRARVEEIVRRAGDPTWILEVGCGDGFLSQALIEAGHKVTSVDIDDAMIARAKELFNLDVIKADIIKLPFQDECFDLVIGAEVLEHLENPGAGLAELFRVAKKRVMITLPVGEYFLGQAAHRWQVGCSVVEHDSGNKYPLEKNIIEVEFIKRKI
jgi:ubiquinone/menaquinone biosynthesis C-methylase UbiE